MVDIEVKTNTSESLVVGRNGARPMIAIHIWEGDNGKLVIDGVGVSGKTLNAGFVIDAKATKILLAEIVKSKFDPDRG